MLLLVTLVIIAPGFASLDNMLNVLRTVSMLGIVAFGMTAVIISGEIDLSVGAGAGLAGCIVAWFAGAYSGRDRPGLGRADRNRRRAGGRIPDGRVHRTHPAVPERADVHHHACAVHRLARLRQSGHRRLSAADLSRLVLVLRRRGPARRAVPGLYSRDRVRADARDHEVHDLRPGNLRGGRQCRGRAAVRHRRGWRQNAGAWR